MTAIYYLMGVLIFAFALLLSIALHECGHMIPAKKFGARVPQFFVGFGRTIWSRTRGETEYGFKAVPLGGYVKIIGMLPPGKGGEHDGEVRSSSTGMLNQLVSDARAAEWDLVRPEDEGRLFYQLPWWKKVIVMAGGPVVNLAIAFTIFLGVFATYGNPADFEIEPVLSEVSGCVVPASETGRPCTEDDPVAPAFKAGLKVDDRLISMNGVEISDWNSVAEVIRANAGGKIDIVYERDGVEKTTTTNTLVTARPDLEDPTKEVEVGFLGVSPSIGDPKRGGALYTSVQMWDMTKQSAVALLKLPQNVFKVAKAIVGLEERDPTGPISIVGGGRIAGETAAAENFPVKEKAIGLLLLIAGFNLFIGILNLVPLLPLDGGHIAGALYEAAKRSLARLLGRPDPGHVDVARMLPLVYVIAGTLLVFGLVLIVGDLVVPIELS